MQHLLRNGTKDLPRMTKILANERVGFFFACGHFQGADKDMCLSIEGFPPRRRRDHQTVQIRASGRD